MDAGPALPSRPFPTSARAPGKCILFGEHAVVRGAPELLLAIDLHAQAVVGPSPRLMLNSDPVAAEQNPYLREALAISGLPAAPLSVRVLSRVPRGSGLGSSAAFLAAVIAALAAGRGGVDRPALAQRCFAAERAAQDGHGSPGDTSASVAGGYLTLNAGKGSGPLLWSVTAGDEGWEARRAEDPGWAWVVAYSGIPRSTEAAVRAVKERLREPDGPAILEEFETVAREGIAATRAGDRATVGRLLTRNHELLRKVGVSHPRLEALIDAARPAAEGAKLTGAGMGGSIVALPIPGREVDLVRRLARAGAVPYPVRPSPGVELVDALAPGPAPTP